MALYGLVSGTTVLETAATIFPVNSSLAWTPDQSTANPGMVAGWTAINNSGTWTVSAPSTFEPTLAQQAATLLTQGFTITSTGTPALNGVYPADPASVARMLQVQQVLQQSSAWPAGASSWQIETYIGGGDTKAVTATQYNNIVNAVAGFAAACQALIAGATFMGLPSASATIP